MSGPTIGGTSDALENGNQIDESFKQVFAPEIGRFKQEYRALHPDKSVENLTDADLLREVVNTVGKPGTLGGHIRCVVSVSMLTEGWDANTVTHIVGIRAFGSQLLCEQVAGRALRRKSYTLQAYTLDGEPIDAANVKRYKPENVIHKFPPEYAHIIGIPFRQFKAGKTQGIIDQKPPKHVRALAERSQLEIQFPNVVGYRVEPSRAQISIDLDAVDNFIVDGSTTPFKTQMATAFNSTQEELRVNVEEFRDQQVFYIITKELIKQKYSDDANRPYFDKFNQLKKIVETWYHEKVKLIGMDANNAEYKKAVLFDLPRAVEHIALAILSNQKNSNNILPVFNHYQKFGSTNSVNGFTTREVYSTRKSPVNYVVADTNEWEQRAAKTLDDMPNVLTYVKNAFLDFRIPYVRAGMQNAFYEPDFIARCQTLSNKTINLIIEITGMNQDKATKRKYVTERWLPAVNAVRDTYQYDKWDFVEISSELTLKDMRNELNKKLQTLV